MINFDLRAAVNELYANEENKQEEDEYSTDKRTQLL